MSSQESDDDASVLFDSVRRTFEASPQHARVNNVAVSTKIQMHKQEGMQTLSESEPIAPQTVYAAAAASKVNNNKTDTTDNSTHKSFGASCHQCKASKPNDELMYCTSTHAGTNISRKCRKKYCVLCLLKSMNKHCAL